MHGNALRPVNPDHLRTIGRERNRFSIAISLLGQSVGRRMVLPPPLAVLFVGHVASAELMNFVISNLVNFVTSNRAWTNRTNQD